MTKQITIDGNEAVARIAYALSEVIAIYPITPASPMGGHADDWSSLNRPKRLKVILTDLSARLEQIGYRTISAARGALSLERAPDPHTWERLNYARLLQSWTPHHAHADKVLSEFKKVSLKSNHRRDQRK